MNASTFRTSIMLVAVLSGCSGEGEPATDAVPAPPRIVRLSSANYTFTAPDTIAEGWSTLRFANNSNEVHYAHIVRLDSGRTVPELVAAYAEAIRTSGPRPTWVTRFGGPGGVAPADSFDVTQRLEPGRYAWICPIEDEAGNPHFGKGEHRAFVVRAKNTGEMDAAAPAANTEIRLHDFTFSFDSTLKAGAHTIRVVNMGVEPHDLVMIKLASGRTMEDVMRSMNPEQARRPGESEPPVPFEELGLPAGGIAAIAPGKEAFFDASLTSGYYVLLCMATAPDGKSHLEHGMIRTLTIP